MAKKWEDIKRDAGITPEDQAKITKWVEKESEEIRKGEPADGTVEKFLLQVERYQLFSPEEFACLMSEALAVVERVKSLEAQNARYEMALRLVDRVCYPWHAEGNAADVQHTCFHAARNALKPEEGDHGTAASDEK